ncbi:GtrA family protein [Amycolatopsis australiensis]|uniref:Putative flippase GtrA (Transmembrane translocase of bactoprenol-linked glucose) n=1 Tax=Amycolatopsis australiensis TaxID=546364 RepID=A0A1K1SC72_9PSEU|nr:GtrA family protein [Amycolatopsis australiensis]SFW81708.1 Putative flippase GtrA (transmembrane translocase of bactoprenol-linked glucose) [Amycolatopsis australiensis]
MTTVTNGVRPRTTDTRATKGRRGWARLARAATTSVAATVLSQVVLLAVLTAGGVPAVASTLAWAAGAVLNFVVTRRWVWGRTGRPRVRRELLPYLVVIGLGGLASIGLTTLSGALLAPLRLPHFWWVVLVDGAYVASYALVFVVKFALLDRLVFGRGAARTPATTSRS